MSRLARLVAGLLSACPAQPVAQSPYLLLGDGTVLRLGGLDEFVEVVALDPAGDGGGDVSGRAGRTAAGTGGFSDASGHRDRVLLG